MDWLNNGCLFCQKKGKVKRRKGQKKDSPQGREDSNLLLSLALVLLFTLLLGGLYNIPLYHIIPHIPQLVYPFTSSGTLVCLFPTRSGVYPDDHDLKEIPHGICKSISPCTG